MNILNILKIVILYRCIFSVTKHNQNNVYVDTLKHSFGLPSYSDSYNHFDNYINTNKNYFNINNTIPDIYKVEMETEYKINEMNKMNNTFTLWK